MYEKLKLRTSVFVTKAVDALNEIIGRDDTISVWVSFHENFLDVDEWLEIKFKINDLVFDICKLSLAKLEPCLQVW